MIGLCLSATAATTYALVSYSENDDVFYSISILARFTQGISDGFTIVGIFAVTAIEFTVDAEKFQSIV
jgi:hypothetical protein